MSTQVYSLGLVYASACSDDEPDEVERRVNIDWPTGIASRWAIADEPFANGAPNPSPCHDDPTRRHYLLVC